MIIEGAIGDAYGAAFEFAPMLFINANNSAEKYFRHPAHWNRYKRYTDDTQMAIGLAEFIVENEEWSSLNIAVSFWKYSKETFVQGMREGFMALC